MLVLSAFLRFIYSPYFPHLINGLYATIIALIDFTSIVALHALNRFHFSMRSTLYALKIN